MKVLHLRAVVLRFEKSQLFGLFVTQRKIEAVAKLQQRCVIEFFLAVGGHLALTGLPHAIAFFGVRQDDGGLALVDCGSCISRVNFDQIMAAAFQSVNLLIAESLSELGKLRVLAKEVIAVKPPILGGEGLHLPVHGVGKSFHQGLLGISGKQAIPVTAPNEFDHIPSRTTKEFF